MKNLNLIRALAWKFHHRSGVEFDELFAEASLAYCEALQTYNDSMNCKLTSYAWLVIRNRLVNVCKREQRTTELFAPTDTPEYIADTNVPEDFLQIIEGWDKEYQEIAFIILNDPERFLGHTPNFKRGTGPKTPRQRIRQELRARGWTLAQIQRAFKHMPKLLAGTEL